MEGGTRRRRLTLSDQMSILDSSNLRDMLRLRDEDDDGRDALAGLTLGAVLGCEDRRAPIQASRTLLDIIKDEESGAAYRGLIPNQNNKKNWKSFKDRLRLRRAGAAWSSSSHPVSACDFNLEDCRIQISRPFAAGPTSRRSFGISPTITTSDARHSIPAATIPPRNVSEVLENVPIVAEINTSTSSSSSSAAATVAERIVMPLSAALAAEREENRLVREEDVMDLGSALAEQGNNAASTTSVAPMRVSLMALLEETDRQAGVVESSTFVGTEEEEDDDDDKEGEEGVEEHVCCVCMLRHKGAAFIPCGHTFCRLCSRELWVSRGNCPLCNGYILEILDIF